MGGKDSDFTKVLNIRNNHLSLWACFSISQHPLNKGFPQLLEGLQRLRDSFKCVPRAKVDTLNMHLYYIVWSHILFFRSVYSLHLGLESVLRGCPVFRDFWPGLVLCHTPNQTSQIGFLNIQMRRRRFHPNPIHLRIQNTFL